VSSEEHNSVMQFGGGCYIPLMEMTQRLTAHICSAPVGRFGLRHIFTSAIATVKTSYMRRTLYEMAAKMLTIKNGGK